MKFIKISSVLLTALLSTSCSQKENNLISELQSLQIPVIQKDNNQNNNESILNTYHTKNTSDISNLTNFLKSTYINGSTKKDIFDNQSQAHHAYIALASLEQAGMVNEQYFNDKNLKGIMALNGVLNPIADEIKSH
ncbi:TPA: hypothetical protein ACUIW5_004898 [Klebsiella pneumoniae]|uniref:hypothetical protein n=1 Tax=Klebsiella pneumoniae TaxID=573 RepID=UPI0012FECD98|nr:hypothetical protein [Klebsiella pneumoniae]MDS0536601.1 hypothetical protein [Klebsiella pneumoniae]HEE1235115.1 hypothetical protein [Klebsiella pneumoniae]